MAGGLNSRPDHIRPAVDGMLKRLRKDRIDLLSDAVRFTPEELRDFNAALARTPVQGARMGRGILSFSGVEAPPNSNDNSGNPEQ